MLLGIDRQQQCVAVSTEKIDHTKVLLQNFPKMTPGSEVFMLNPQRTSYNIAAPIPYGNSCTNCQLATQTNY